jgi:hypothetical protein
MARIAGTLHEDVCTFDSIETTSKMQPCNRIYYSTVHSDLTTAGHHMRM